MSLRQIEFPDLEEIETKEIEIPEKCKTEKFENLISENVEIEETENPEGDGEVETPTEVETPIEVEETEITEAEETIIVENDDGSIEMLSKICAQMDTLLESQEAVTEFETKSGPIAVVHTITLGDLILSTLLAAVLIVQIISKTIRRS